MRSRFGIFSVLLLLTHSCYSISCRTCKNEECVNINVPVITCNRNTPILPFRAPSIENKERLQYGCLQLEYLNGNFPSALEQCIQTRDIKEFCTSISQGVYVTRCSVYITEENRFKQETKDIDKTVEHSSSNYNIFSADHVDETDSSLAISTPSDTEDVSDAIDFTPRSLSDLSTSDINENTLYDSSSVITTSISDGAGYEFITETSDSTTFIRSTNDKQKEYSLISKYSEIYETNTDNLSVIIESERTSIPTKYTTNPSDDINSENINAEGDSTTWQSQSHHAITPEDFDGYEDLLTKVSNKPNISNIETDEDPNKFTDFTTPEADSSSATNKNIPILEVYLTTIISYSSSSLIVSDISNINRESGTNEPPDSTILADLDFNLKVANEDFTTIDPEFLDPYKYFLTTQVNDLDSSGQPIDFTTTEFSDLAEVVDPINHELALELTTILSSNSPLIDLVTTEPSNSTTAFSDKLITSENLEGVYKDLATSQSSKLSDVDDLESDATEFTTIQDTAQPSVVDFNISVSDTRVFTIISPDYSHKTSVHDFETTEPIYADKTTDSDINLIDFVTTQIAYTSSKNSDNKEDSRYISENFNEYEQLLEEAKTTTLDILEGSITPDQITISTDSQEEYSPEVVNLIISEIKADLTDILSTTIKSKTKNAHEDLDAADQDETTDSSGITPAPNAGGSSTLISFYISMLLVTMPLLNLM